MDVAVLLVVTSRTVSPTAADRSSQECAPQEQHLLVTSLANNFNLAVGGPQPIRVRVINKCGTEVIGSSVVASFSTGDRPLILTDLRNGNFTGTWSPQNLTGQVKILVQATHPTLQPAKLELSGSTLPSVAPQVFRNGAVNAATFAPLTPPAPGSITSVFGRNLAEGVNLSTSVPLARNLGGLALRLGSLEVPLFYSSSGQVNAQIPFEIPQNTTQMLVGSL